MHRRHQSECTDIENYLTTIEIRTCNFLRNPVMFLHTIDYILNLYLYVHSMMFTPCLCYLYILAKQIQFQPAVYLGLPSLVFVSSLNSDKLQELNEVNTVNTISLW